MRHWHTRQAEFEEHVNMSRSEAGPQGGWNMKAWIEPTTTFLASGLLSSEMYTLMLADKLKVALVHVDTADPFDPDDYGMAFSTLTYLTCLNKSCILPSEGFVPFYQQTEAQLQFTKTDADGFNGVWLDFGESWRTFLLREAPRESRPRAHPNKPPGAKRPRNDKKEKADLDWFAAEVGRGRDMYLARYVKQKEGANFETLSRQFSKLVERLDEFAKMPSPWKQNELDNIIELLADDHPSQMCNVDTEQKLLEAAKKLLARHVQDAKEAKARKAAERKKGTIESAAPKPSGSKENASQGKPPYQGMTLDQVVNSWATFANAGLDVPPRTGAARGSSKPSNELVTQLEKLTTTLEASVDKINKASSQMTQDPSGSSKETKDLRKIMSIMFPYVVIDDRRSYREFRLQCLRFSIPVDLYMCAIRGTEYYIEKVKPSGISDKQEREEYEAAVEEQNENPMYAFPAYEKA